MNPHQDGPPTVVLIPLGELLALARLGLLMRRTQREFFEARKRCPHGRSDAEFRAAKDAERRFDAALTAALAREQPALFDRDGGQYPTAG